MEVLEMQILYGIVFLFCFLLARAVAQETKPIPPVTEKEEIHILYLQKLAMRSETALQEAMKKLPEYVAAQKAENDLQVAGKKLYEDRKLTQNDALLCDGPTPGACSDVPEGRIAFRKKVEAKK
jgi:hypothetical protein